MIDRIMFIRDEIKKMKQKKNKNKHEDVGTCGTLTGFVLVNSHWIGIIKYYVIILFRIKSRNDKYSK